VDAPENTWITTSVELAVGASGEALSPEELGIPSVDAQSVFSEVMATMNLDELRERQLHQDAMTGFGDPGGFFGGGLGWDWLRWSKDGEAFREIDLIACNRLRARTRATAQSPRRVSAAHRRPIRLRRRSRRVHRSEPPGGFTGGTAALARSPF
jgi:hypothetical protein